MKRWITKDRYQIEFRDGSIKRLYADEYETHCSNTTFYRYHAVDGKVKPQKSCVASVIEDDIRSIILLDHDYPVEEVREPYITDEQIKDKPIVILALKEVASDMYKATENYIDANAPQSKALARAIEGIEIIIECMRKENNENNY